MDVFIWRKPNDSPAPVDYRFAVEGIQGMQIVKDYLDALMHLIYPEFCISCRELFPIKGNSFCIHCLEELSFTTHFDIAQNDFHDKFYGRVKIEFGGALINYHAGHKVRNMLHALKYKRQKIVAEELGRMLAKKLNQCDFFERPDYLVPVPIHAKKKIRRGYNQAELIADAMSGFLNIKVRNDVLIKSRKGISQTKKTRMERATDIEETIALKNTRGLKGKHIMIIDDVMTTGATLEACALKLLNIEGLRFSFATLAMTKS